MPNKKDDESGKDGNDVLLFIYLFIYLRKKYQFEKKKERNDYNEKFMIKYLAVTIFMKFLP